MEDLHDPLYRKLYMDGYVFGQNPAFVDCEDIAKSAPRYNNRAFLTGFRTGRQDYERYNGKLEKGVPKKILTSKLLEKFKSSGELGMPLEAVGFTSSQMQFIKNSYAQGKNLYCPENDFNLYLILQENGIDIKK